MSAVAALRVGTRASALALWQARHVAALIAAQPGAPAVELVHIKTSGDVQTDVPLWQVGGQAFFTREIDRALLAGEVDVAVHSLKDLSTQLEAGLTLAAALKRADPRDALVSRSGARLAQLPRGARIGTSSLRRRAFLARARPDAQWLELRGNVPTRLERLQRGDYDAIVLAAAGLARLNLESQVSEYLPADQFPPAVSQGVIGVCARSGDAATLRWLSGLDDPDSRITSAAERALLRRLEAGCQVPLGALASVHEGTLSLQACVCALDGSRHLSAHGQVPASAVAGEALGVRLAEELLARGAAELIASERTARAVAEP
ncbi:MAG TPA: hydroxymethylbilane synthase [Steroidobacteraceae bacterium]|nr:hydroxymethylbilane synthase [Steroidobacteraceae bacterium]